jgi:O-antigen ligase
MGGSAIALLAFVGWAGASSLWSVDGRSTLLKSLTLLVQILLALALATRYRSIDQLLNALVAVCIAVLGTVILGLAVAPDVVWSNSETGIRRLGGWMPVLHPNTLAIVGVIVILGYVTRVGPWILLRGGLGFLVLSVAVVETLLTRSRTTLVVGMVIVGLVIGINAFRKRSYLTLGLLGGAGAAVFVVFALQHIQEFLRRGQSIQQIESLTGRTSYWNQALDLWSHRPIAGFGYYSGHRIALTPPSGQAPASNLDNVWIETLLNQGIVGACLLAMVIVLAAWTLLRPPAQVTGSALAFARATFVLFCATTFYNPSLQTVGLGGALFTVLIFAVGGLRRTTQSAEASSSDSAIVSPLARVSVDS